MIRFEAYHREIAKSYNKRVGRRKFVEGDLVLRKVLGHMKVRSHGKLGSNWEGPCRVISLAGKGAYRLEDQKGRKIIRPWNISNLRRFYH